MCVRISRKSVRGRRIKPRRALHSDARNQPGARRCCEKSPTQTVGAIPELCVCNRSCLFERADLNRRPRLPDSGSGRQLGTQTSDQRIKCWNRLNLHVDGSGTCSACYPLPHCQARQTKSCSMLAGAVTAHPLLSISQPRFIRVKKVLTPFPLSPGRLVPDLGRPLRRALE